MKLILFDIDGTLLIGRSDMYRDPLNRAGRELFHPEFRIEVVDRLGALDAWILEEALAGFAMVPTAEQTVLFRDKYLEYLAEAVSSGTVLPGASELLDQLETMDHIVLGLVTGNYREAARLKLDGVGLRFDRFAVGGFGDRKTTRAGLVREAIEQAESRFNRSFPPDQVIVVGDTLKDIQCARENNCRAVAVAAGWVSRETLSQGSPDLLLDSLAEIDRFKFFLTETETSETGPPA